MKKIGAQRAFTLTEVLIAVAIVGIIAGLVLPKVIENYQTKTMDSAFQREVQTIEDSINGLAVSENKADFFSTMMYKDTAPESYDDSSGAYMEKYLRTSKMCDNPKDCFAPTYYQYEAGKSRKEYKPDYKGSCAILKNGMSICMIPQIGAANITGIIDLNGKKGPNVLDRDLRTFSIAAKTRVGLNQDTEGIRKLDWDNLEPGEEPEVEPDPPTPPTPTDPCDVNKNSLDCCKKRAITSKSDACCTYSEIKNSNSVCKDAEVIDISVTCSKSDSSTGSNSGRRTLVCNMTTSPNSTRVGLQMEYCPQTNAGSGCNTSTKRVYIYGRGRQSITYYSTSRLTYGGNQYLFYENVRLYENGPGITIKSGINTNGTTNVRYNFSTHKIE